MRASKLLLIALLAFLSIAIASEAKQKPLPPGCTFPECGYGADGKCYRCSEFGCFPC